MCDYDYFGNLKVFDEADRSAIEWGLQHIFDYDISKINRAVAAQVCRGCSLTILYSNCVILAD